MNTAKAHCRTDRKYFSIYKSLLLHNGYKSYTLKHLTQQVFQRKEILLSRLSRFQFLLYNKINELPEVIPQGQTQKYEKRTGD